MAAEKLTIFCALLKTDLVAARLEKFFGQIGQIKDDKKSKEKGKKKIWIYRNKATGQPKGDATVTYTDASGARSVESALKFTP